MSLLCPEASWPLAGCSTTQMFDVKAIEKLKDGSISGETSNLIWVCV